MKRRQTASKGRIHRESVSGPRMNGDLKPLLSFSFFTVQLSNRIISPLSAPYRTSSKVSPSHTQIFKTIGFWSFSFFFDSAAGMPYLSSGGAKVVAIGAAAATAAFGLFYLWVRRSNRKGDSKLVRSQRALLHDKFKKSKVPDDLDVIIIGSGMSGLSCAAILARLGRKVVVLEQHPDVAGGGTHMFDIGSYRFDSGLHYTVPWSEPIFALTCLKKLGDVCKLDLMGDDQGTVDKIFLTPPPSVDTSSGKHDEFMVQPFLMQTGELHIPELYKQFASEKKALDKFMVESDRAMLFVKLFIFSRLLPKWLQDVFWNLVPRCMVEGVGCTAKQLLPSLTQDKRLLSLLSSMWIDTGARPDRASFMLTAAVFRGVAMEGGCYPRGGSEAMARELVPVIEQHGGRVLIRAPVDEILLEGGRAVGVRLKDGTELRAKQAVVSSVGYANTFGPGKLIRDEGTVGRELGVEQSAGFVMVNLGIGASAQELGIANSNIWHIPVDDSYDAFPALEAYFADPLLLPPHRIPAFITFPSLKDRAWADKHPGKTTVQVLLMAEYEWFLKGYSELRGDAERSAAYLDAKNRWADLVTSLVISYVPAAKGKIEVCDVSTPLTIERYLAAHKGAAVGADVTPKRFADRDVRRRLDCRTDIDGLWLTGQDTLLCGVTLCQLAGVITAFRMEGLLQSVKVVAMSVFNGWGIL